MAPLRRLKYHLKLTDGEMLFVARQAANVVSPFQEQVVINIYCMNDMMRRGWLAALRDLDQLAALHAGAFPPSEEPSGDNDSDRHKFVNFLHRPESHWERLYGPDSSVNKKDDAYTMMHWLSKQGILERYIPVGAVILQPQIQFAPSEPPRTTSRMQMTFAMAGVGYVTNIWGPKATNGTWLFLILKRIRDRQTGNYTQFAFVPYTNTERTVPSKELEYLGVSGNKEIGTAFLVGWVIDVLGAPPPEERVPRLVGLADKGVDDAHILSNNGTKMKVMLVAPRQLS